MPKRFHYDISGLNAMIGIISLARLLNTVFRFQSTVCKISEYCSRLYSQNEQYTHIFLISFTPSTS